MAKSTMLRVLVSFGLVGILLTATQAGAAPVVSTTSGPVEGFTQDGLSVFLGIPYVAPPVGNLRWKSPQPVLPWAPVVRNATTVGPQCPQISFGFLVGNEDCLYLNVWTPASASTARLPVMVWIHGGGHTGGSGDGGLSFIDGKPQYDGQHLARNGDVVLVSFNYRLGPFGFLAHPALTAEEPAHPSSGNYGQEDQVAALRWVRDNIAAFGGDPHNVTIFGESAGGVSVSLHLVSPRSDGLFHRAIIQSGAADRRPTLGQVQFQGLAFAAALGCGGAPDVLACLRSKSRNEVLSALPLPAGFFFGSGAFWGPIVDGHLLLDQPLKAFSTGHFSQVPLMIGNTANEGTLFPALVGANLTPAIYDTFLNRFFGVNADAVRAAYPCSNADCSAFTPPRFLLSPADNAIAEVATNGLFLCPARRVARAISSHHTPIYFYTFDRAVDSPFWPFDIGAAHFAEISFVFGTAALSQLTAEEKPLSRAMMDYWTDFAWDGNPNHGKARKWPLYRFGPSKDEKRIVFDLKIKQATHFHANNCDFFDRLFFGAGG
jgi:para-nitrobenzyl esterase